MSGSTPRRKFFQYAMDELVAAVDESRGRPSFKLSDLGGLPDDELGRLVPAILDVSHVSGQGDYFVLKMPGRGAELLFAKGSHEEEVWSRIDGHATIQQIADALALAWNAPGEVAFARVRRLFLHLVNKRLCLPLNPLV
jgi:hypothetical protein